ncbi:hypothetical protein [Kineococcus sp. SYSU DK002]|uniref:hypothetical protein n=1 Tax=Kineococcus sp. SYSU DK002 TaxID=3383123 RepID=UPI003D7C810E
MTTDLQFATRGTALAGAVGTAFSWPVHRWTEQPVEAFPATPYPGLTPLGSFLVHAGTVRGLRDDSELRVRATGEPVEDHLARNACTPLDQRVAVLAYGSNANPVKLTEKLLRHAPGDAVVGVQAHVHDAAAAWCDRTRGDGELPATLVPRPGHTELHHVLLIPQDLLEHMHRWEGVRGGYYAYDPLTIGSVRLPVAWDDTIHCYVGAEHRPPLQVDGVHVLCHSVPQQRARRLAAGAR